MGGIPIKKLLLILLIIILCMGSLSHAAIPVNASSEKGQMYFDGSSLLYKFNRFAVNETDMISVQGLSALLFAQYSQNPSNKKIKISTETDSIVLQIGSKTAFINEMEYQLPVPVISSGKTVYVALDFAVLASSGQVEWDLSKNIAFTMPYPTLENHIIERGEHLTQFPYQTIIHSALPLGSLTLVSKDHPMSSEYIPSALSSVIDKNGRYVLPAKVKSVKLHPAALDALKKLFKAASSGGAKNLIISSGYRSFQDQTYFFNKKINTLSRGLDLKDARIKAATIVAPPGMSEHQTGLAVDITTRSLLRTAVPLSATFGNTPEGKWVNENCWKFGYVVRYQKEKTKITGIISEPWHLRYVGIPHAEIMKETGFCLEEYLEYIKKEKYIKYTTASHKTYEIFYINLIPPFENLTLVSDSNSYTDITRYGKTSYIVTKGS